jgi:hypothetical protein
MSSMPSFSTLLPTSRFAGAVFALAFACMPCLSPAVCAQAQDEDPLAQYNFSLRYAPGRGPTVTTPKEEFWLDDFQINGRTLTWPLEIAQERELPTGFRKAFGLSVRGTVIDDQGKNYTINILAQAQTLIWDVSGLPPNQPYTLRVRLRSKTPTVKMVSTSVLPVVPPVVQCALGDPDFWGDVAYDVQTDRAYRVEPKKIGRIGALDADGSRWLEWTNTTSATGEANANVVHVTYYGFGNELGIPPDAVKAPATDRAMAGWRTAAFPADLSGSSALLDQARKIHELFAPYGMEYFIVDQASAAGDTHHFPEGLAPFARQLKQIGWKPGIVTSPMAAPADGSTGILQHADNTAFDGGSLGPKVYNVASAEARTQIGEAAAKLVADGFDLLYLTGQREYLSVLKQAEQEMPGKITARKDYRDGITALRKAAGDSVRLVGGALSTVAESGDQPKPIPPELFGLFDTIQTGDLREATESGFGAFAYAISKGLKGHGLVQMSDPGPVRVGGKLTREQVQAWVSLVALTGQSFFVSDALPSLTAEKIDIIRRGLPVLPVRTAYVPKESPYPRIAQLWYGSGADTSLIAGYFKFSPLEDDVPGWFHSDSTQEFLAGSERYEYWTHRFIGRARPEQYLQMYVPDGECAVVAARKARPWPFVISTSRHVSQGAVDLKNEKYDESTMTLSGTSELVGGDPYELRIVLPTREWVATEVSAAADGPATFENSQRLARVKFASNVSKSVAWTVKFSKKEPDKTSAAREPWSVTDLKARPGREPSVVLQWSLAKAPTGIFYVKRDGDIVGSTLGDTFVDSTPSLRFNVKYVYEVIAVDDEGHEGPPARIEVTTMQPPRVNLSDFHVTQRRSAAPYVGRNQSVKSTPITLQGTVYKKGMGAAPPSILDIPLRGARGSFVATIGIDDAAGKQGSAVVGVYLDDKKVGETQVLKGGEKPQTVRIRLPRGEKLTLMIEDSGDGWDFDFVDIADPEIVLTQNPGGRNPVSSRPSRK